MGDAASVAASSASTAAAMAAADTSSPVISAVPTLAGRRVFVAKATETAGRGADEYVPKSRDMDLLFTGDRAVQSSATASTTTGDTGGGATEVPPGDGATAGPAAVTAPDVTMRGGGAARAGTAEVPAVGPAVGPPTGPPTGPRPGGAPRGGADANGPRAAGGAPGGGGRGVAIIASGFERSGTPLSERRTSVMSH